MIEVIYFKSHGLPGSIWRRTELFADSELPAAYGDICNTIGTEKVVVHREDGGTITYKAILDPSPRQRAELVKQQRARQVKRRARRS